MMDRWSLPGPASFIASVQEALREGSNVVVGASFSGARSLYPILEDRVSEEWRITGPIAPFGAAPIDEIYDALDVQDEKNSRRSVASLISDIDSKRVIVITGVETPQWATWQRFVEDYANASRAVPAIDRTQLLVITAGVPKARLPARAPALLPVVCDGFVGEADVFSYVVQAWRSRGQRVDAGAKLIARIITRLATWDLSLADRLLELDQRSLFDPEGALRSLVQMDSAFRGLGATWEEGGVADFDGELSTHAATLLNGGDHGGELRMRLWAAQAAELLPALELHRRALCKRMRAARISLPVTLNGEKFHDLADIEIGQLLHVARVNRLPPDIIRIAERLWRLRNKLAHLTPLTADEASDFLGVEWA